MFVKSSLELTALLALSVSPQALGAEEQHPRGVHVSGCMFNEGARARALEPNSCCESSSSIAIVFKATPTQRTSYVELFQCNMSDLSHEG